MAPLSYNSTLSNPYAQTKTKIAPNYQEKMGNATSYNFRSANNNINEISNLNAPKLYNETLKANSYNFTNEKNYHASSYMNNNNDNFRDPIKTTNNLNSPENIHKSPIKSNVFKSGVDFEKENLTTFSPNYQLTQKNEKFTNKNLIDTLSAKQWEPPSLLKVQNILIFLIFFKIFSIFRIFLIF